jgi:formylglycine-generating enzyme required for sulfatase activity
MIPKSMNNRPRMFSFSGGPHSGQLRPGRSIPRAPRPDRRLNAIVWMMAVTIVILLVLVGVLLAKSLAEAPIPVLTGTPTALNLSLKTTVGTTPASKLVSQTPSLVFTPIVTLTLTAVPPPVATLSPTVQLTATALSGAPECATIGQTWVRPADKMVMMCVPEGSFPMGMAKCDFAGCEKEVNGGNVNLPAYWIDRSEVTNAMFQEFVQQTGYVTGAEKSGASEVYGLLQAVAGANWQTPQGPGSSIAGKANHPVVQMNWYSANAYCKWAGGSLPSEAEWEKAARGSDGRLWPWGNTLPSDQLMNAADKNVPAPQSRMDQNDGFRYTSPVGYFPAGTSPYGLVDMAGNAWEWTRSILRTYPYVPDDGREIQTAPGPGDRPVLRGGCWFDDYGSLRSTMRYGGTPELSTDGLSFRCVYP